VDRIAVIVTGNGIEKLLAVPKIGRGTGSEQAAACLTVIDEWKISDVVQGLVFDTIHRPILAFTRELVSSSRIRELVNIGCRHHVLEVILSNVFTALVKPGDLK